MATRSAKALNREQTVFCCALVLLITCAVVIGWVQSSPQCSLRSFYSALFGSVPPELLTEEPPLTSVPPPPVLFCGGAPEQLMPSDMSRASPFMPPRKAIGGNGDWWKSVLGVARGMFRVSGQAVETVNGGDEKPKTVRPGPLDDVSVAYMGVLGASGQRVGMLRVKNGHFLNVREGDQLLDLGCTVIRVEKESIHLMTRTGIYHILSRTGS